MGILSTFRVFFPFCSLYEWCQLGWEWSLRYVRSWFHYVRWLWGLIVHLVLVLYLLFLLWLWVWCGLQWCWVVWVCWRRRLRLAWQRRVRIRLYRLWLSYRRSLLRGFLFRWDRWRGWRYRSRWRECGRLRRHHLRCFGGLGLARLWHQLPLRLLLRV